MEGFCHDGVGEAGRGSLITMEEGRSLGIVLHAHPLRPRMVLSPSICLFFACSVVITDSCLVILDSMLQYYLSDLTRMVITRSIWLFFFCNDVTTVSFLALQSNTLHFVSFPTQHKTRPKLAALVLGVAMKRRKFWETTQGSSISIWL